MESNNQRITPTGRQSIKIHYTQLARAASNGDDQKGGRFRNALVANDVRCRQFYWPSANILVTRFLREDGIAELEDFMPVGLPEDSRWYRHLYRRIRCVRGTVRISLLCQPAFNYGTQPHHTHIGQQGAFFKSSDYSLTLLPACPWSKPRTARPPPKFDLQEGEAQVFTLSSLYQSRYLI